MEGATGAHTQRWAHSSIPADPGSVSWSERSRPWVQQPAGTCPKPCETGSLGTAPTASFSLDTAGWEPYGEALG